MRLLGGSCTMIVTAVYPVIHGANEVTNKFSEERIKRKTFPLAIGLTDK